MRLFLAINPPADVRRDVIAATQPLRECVPELSWVGEPRLHLTLKFLGEEPVERLPEIRDALLGVTRMHRHVAMSLGGVGAFPNFRRARVVWLGIGPEPRLELLHHDVELAFKEIGFEIEGRPFRPHLTLARARHTVSEDRLRALARHARVTDYEAEFIVESIDLMQSELSASGSAYATLTAAALRSE